jgi:hypothetical protein
MYFKKFPNIVYEYNVGGESVLKLVSDITTNVRFRKSILENITLFDEYDIQEGETPEIIADKVYGNATYHWVVMLCNQRYDYAEDFPLSYGVFQEYVKDKYGDDLYAVHHYEKDGFVVLSDVIGAELVTNYDYEDRLNESKRRIKLISPALLANILTQFKTMI